MGREPLPNQTRRPRQPPGEATHRRQRPSEHHAALLLQLLVRPHHGEGIDDRVVQPPDVPEPQATALDCAHVLVKAVRILSPGEPVNRMGFEEGRELLVVGDDMLAAAKKVPFGRSTLVTSRATASRSRVWCRTWRA